MTLKNLHFSLSSLWILLHARPHYATATSVRTRDRSTDFLPRVRRRFREFETADSNLRRRAIANYLVIRPTVRPRNANNSKSIGQDKSVSVYRFDGGGGGGV